MTSLTLQYLKEQVLGPAKLQEFTVESLSRDLAVNDRQAMAILNGMPKQLTTVGLVRPHLVMAKLRAEANDILLLYQLKSWDGESELQYFWLCAFRSQELKIVDFYPLRVA